MDSTQQAGGLVARFSFIVTVKGGGGYVILGRQHSALRRSATLKESFGLTQINRWKRDALVGIIVRKALAEISRSRTGHNCQMQGKHANDPVSVNHGLANVEQRALFHPQGTMTVLCRLHELQSPHTYHYVQRTGLYLVSTERKHLCANTQNVVALCTCTC